MGNKTVDGDNLNGLWDAMSGTEPFTVCWDKMFEHCADAPGFGTWGALGLLCLEVLFWLLVAREGYKRVKSNKASQKEHGEGQGASPYDNGNGQRSQRRIKRSPFASRKNNNNHRVYAKHNRRRSKRR